MLQTDGRTDRQLIMATKSYIRLMQCYPMHAGGAGRLERDKGRLKLQELAYYCKHIQYAFMLMMLFLQLLQLQLQLLQLQLQLLLLLLLLPVADPSMGGLGGCPH